MYLFFIVFFLFITGCANFSTFQTSRALPPSSYRFNFGMGYITSLTSAQDFTNSNHSPIQFIIGGRTGLAKKLDIGAKSTILGSTSIDLKYQFIDYGILSAALSTGIGYTKLKTNTEEPIYSELMPPPALHFGIDPLDWLGLYSSFKFLIYTRLDKNDVQRKYIINSLGLRLGNTIGTFFEVNFINELPFNLKAIQLGITLFVGNAPSAGYYIPREESPRKDITNPTKYKKEELPLNYDTPHIKYVSARYRVIVITHDTLRAWKIGDKVCVFANEVKMACGRVEKLSPAGAVVKISGRRGELVPGMEVRLKEDD